MSSNNININGVSLAEIINHTEGLPNQNKKPTDIAGNNLIVTPQQDSQLSDDDVRHAFNVFVAKDNLSDLNNGLQPTLQFDARQELFNTPSNVNWGNAQVLTDNTQKSNPNFKDSEITPTSESLNDRYKNLTQVSRDGEWEAITGGDKDTLLTLDKAQKTLSDPDSRLSGDTKKSLQWTVNNWSAITGDNNKTLSLDQAQELGATPKDDKPDDKAPKDDKPDGTTGDAVSSASKQHTGNDGVGDCFFLSGVRALSQTDNGKQLIDDAVTTNKDGSYDITFPGDPSKNTYHVNKNDINGKYASGDPTMQALCVAGDQYFKDKGDKDGITQGGLTSQVYQMFCGDQGTQKTLPFPSDEMNKDDVKKYLTDLAPGIGKDTALTLQGVPDENENWAPYSKGGEDDRHEFQITKIDTASGIVSYNNPWDTSITRTINIDDLAKQITKNGGQFSEQTFS